ncbi:thioredoxin domain-containing protein [Streptomyces antarcticus]|uniref:thioredoxin domain-containing protein n=1 Tax=Streptomyces antarcticus TaxID=2996458 RepID=UPI0022718CD4|nr:MULTISPECIES: thioredoxin domain-containing protein [unclassified Streptomyces]MCY0940735.1 thioredoxin domain-containing protein [Streptomyces sp. H34-AA3]MCZ4081998.1 thioredoxin domain-containing protein [Streptomyces sp. H34-S5]
MSNRLADETSPYLLQHADNPVDWWPWSPEAFAEARERGVPVLLSVGYSSCHWCHVMAHESFEDELTAAYMNEHFVNIKVDREERPDVDAVYMEAVQAATGHGGWPMSVFMTADGEPFYFGTYFPPEPRHGTASFMQVLEGVRTAWVGRREEVAEVAQKITRDLAGRALGAGGEGLPTAESQGNALLQLTRDYDPASGWFGGGDTRFPPSMVVEFLLRHHARTGSEGAREMAEGACEAMVRSSLFDQVGGGFHRYVLRAKPDGPLVPHFEKMLYDNALLCRVYAHLWRATGSDLARRVALETADFMVRELRTEHGGFASALDADSADPLTGAHVEGAYYAWTPAQLRDVLGEDDGDLAAAYFGVTEEGTFEHGASVLQLPQDGPAAEAGRIASIRERLLAARAARPAPGRDDKVVAAWNGLAVAALAECGAYFDRPDLVERATEAADLLVRVHFDVPSGRARLARTSKDGRVGANAGVLEDYGDVAEGFLALASVTGEGVWLEFAGFLVDLVLDLFAAEDGSLYDTAHDAEQLIRRPQDPTDTAAPSGWTAAAGALLSYAAHTGSQAHRTAAERALGVVHALGPRAPRFIGHGLAVAEALLDGPREVAVVGRPEDPALAELHRVALLGTAPGAVVATGMPRAADGSGGEFPLLAERTLVGGLPTAYVCRHFVCARPTTDPDELAGQVGAEATRGV